MKENNKFTKIKIRIVTYFVSLLIVLSILLYSSGYYLYDAASKKEKGKYFTSLLIQKKTELERTLNDYLYSAMMISPRFGEEHPDDEVTEKIIAHALKPALRDEVAGIYKTDGNGRLQWHYKRKKVNYMIPPVGKLSGGAVDLISVDQTIFIVINTPVKTDDGKEGIMHVYFLADTFYNTFADTVYYKKGFVIAITQKLENRRFASVAGLFSPSIDPRVQKEYIDQLNRYKLAFPALEIINEGHQVYLYEILNGTNFCIMLIIDKTYFTSSLNYSMFLLLVLTIIMIVSGIVGLFYLLRPVEDMFMLHIDNLDHIINEKTAKAEQVYTDFIYEKEKALKYINIVGVMLISLDREYHITLINKKGCEILGYEESSLLTQDIFGHFIPEENTDEMRTLMDKIVSGKYENDKSYEGYIINSKGDRRIISWNLAPLYDPVSGGITGILSAGEDITEKRALEEEYRQAQKMESIGRLAGGIAHDFNNLLTIIIGNTDILMSEVEKESSIYRDLESISKASARAVSLTDQLLAFSRKQILNPQVFIVNSSIINVTKMLKRLLGENISIETLLAEDLYKVKADKGQIEQILLNLAVNARDAMEHGGTIAITTKNIHIDSYYCKYYRDARPGQFICISFSDTGVGISEAIQKNIFEPFFTTKEKGKGTGLGLSVVYGIVKQHEGWINVRSKEGEGTTFYVYLPALLEDKEEKQEDTDDIDSYYGHDETVLFIEDEEEIRKIMASILQRKGYNVITAANYTEGLSAYEENAKRIDLIFTDIVLPDSSGVQLINALEKKHKKLNVIFCSGYIGDNKEIENLLAKGYSFLQKPYSIIELLKFFRMKLD